MLRLLNKFFKSFISLSFILSMFIAHHAYACVKHNKKGEQAGSGTTQSQNEKQNAEANDAKDVSRTENRAKKDDQARMEHALLLASVDKKSTASKSAVADVNENPTDAIAKVTDVKEERDEKEHKDKKEQSKSKLEVAKEATKPVSNETSKQTTVSSVKDNSVKEAASKDAITLEARSEKVEKSENAENSENVANNESNINVVEFVLANQVESREPKIVEAFSNQDERGFAFARLNVKNASEVTFVWSRNGHEVNRTTLPVHEAKKWRTFSSVKLRSGEWKVQLLANNQVLAEKNFSVE